jgi:GntR family transcriptional regulator, transcriptional repressor for pyruvate dehydrogenase complex
LTIPDSDTAHPPGIETDGPAFFAPYRQNRLPDQVYEQVLMQVSVGRMGVGDRLPSEPELARSLRVSRPVVRAALARLRADGIVDSRQGSGSFIVRVPSVDFVSSAPSGSIAELLRCFEMRVAVEGEAAYLAAGRRSAADLAAMEESTIRLSEEFGKEGPGADFGADPDVAFHLAVSAATRNHLFARTMEMLRQPIRDGIATARQLARRYIAERLPLVLTEHRAIIDAIRNGDADQARATMRDHIERSRNRMLGFAAPAEPS